MERLKIAHFCWESLYSERVGGLASAATHLAETQALEHEVHFFTRGRGVDTGIQGVQYHYCQPSGDNIVSYCASMSQGMIERFGEFDSPSFDVLHFHDWHAVSALHELQDRPTVLTLHSTEYGRNGNRTGTGWEFQEISGKEYYGGSIAKRVTAVSSALLDEAVHLYDIPEWKVDVVPNGIVSEDYRAEVDSDAVKKTYGVEESSPLILYVGRLAYKKGPDLLLDALPELLQQNEDTQVLYVGDGHMRHALEERSKTLPVQFLGYLPDSQYVPLLNASDIVVIPSRNEPFGLVLLEAWSAGRCVVASDVGGLSENIDHGMDGIKVFPSSGDIAEGVAQVAGYPGRIMSLGKHGQKKVEERFHWESVAERMNDIYKKTSD
jgi:glycogen synthase